MKGLKTGGRKLGTPNKISSELKQALSEYCLKEFQFLSSDIERLSVSERLILFTKVLPYVIPKAEGNNAEVVSSTPVHIIFTN
jgi:hypothetical protein